MKRRIALCGNIAFDLVARKDRKTGGLFFRALPGGSVSNTAVLLSKLGMAVSLISKTGTDFLSDALISALNTSGVSTEYISRDKNIKTSLAFAKIDKSGHSTYTFYRTGKLDLSGDIKKIPSSFFRGVSVFHTGSIFSYDDHACKSVLSLAENAKNKNVFLTYDPNWRGYRIKNKPAARKRIRAILKHVDLLKLSVNDAFGITGSKTLAESLKKLRLMTRGKIIVTRGKNGSFFWDKSKKMHQNAFKVRIADTIGAGDAFTAGLIYRYIKLGRPLFFEKMKGNLAFASALAALVCTRSGATDGVKNLRQVELFLKGKTGDSL